MCLCVVCVRESVFARVREIARARACVCVYVCVGAYIYVFMCGCGCVRMGALGNRWRSCSNVLRGRENQ